MHHTFDRASRIFLAIIFVAALGLLVVNLLRLSPETLATLRQEPASVSGAFATPAETSVPMASTDATRPKDVGNADAEDFLRKLERPPAVPGTGLIRLTDENFSAGYDELYDHRDAYYGREVELAGYVMREDGLGAGGFLVGRELLWCCEDDLYFIGFVAFADGEAPAQDFPVRVRGTLEEYRYTSPENGKVFNVPAIRVRRIDPEPHVPRRVYQNLG